MSTATRSHSVSLLSCPRARQRYRNVRPHQPRHPVTAAVHRDTVKDTPCIKRCFNTQTQIYLFLEKKHPIKNSNNGQNSAGKTTTFNLCEFRTALKLMDGRKPSRRCSKKRRQCCKQIRSSVAEVSTKALKITQKKNANKYNVRAAQVCVETLHITVHSSQTAILVEYSEFAFTEHFYLSPMNGLLKKKLAKKNVTSIKIEKSTFSDSNVQE